MPDPDNKTGLRDVGDDREVNHPDHYNVNGLEAIDVIEKFNLNFNLGNAAKYILRAGRKGPLGARNKDLRKAAWYLLREIERNAD